MGLYNFAWSPLVKSGHGLSTVASLGLVSLGSETDVVTPIFSEKKN